jgi:hypothetical protein
MGAQTSLLIHVEFAVGKIKKTFLNYPEIGTCFLHMGLWQTAMADLLKKQ